MEALEEYSATHPESVEELKNWYWKRFEVLYEAYSKRKAVDEAKTTKIALIQALHANTNYDDGKNTRQIAIQNIENSYQEAVNIIYNMEYEFTSDQEEDDKLMENPFFSAMKLDDPI